MTFQKVLNLLENFYTNSMNKAKKLLIFEMSSNYNAKKYNLTPNFGRFIRKI